jgi:hypothetical protein
MLWWGGPLTRFNVGLVDLWIEALPECDRSLVAFDTDREFRL